MANYPNSTVDLLKYVPGQTLAGPPAHHAMHNEIEGEIEAIALYAAKGVRGGEELIHTEPNVPVGYTIDLKLGNIHRVLLTGNATITFPSAASITDGRSASFVLELVQDATGGRVPTLPGAIRWLPAGAAPTMSTVANKRNLLSFLTTDDGVTWWGSYAGVG